MPPGGWRTTGPNLLPSAPTPTLGRIVVRQLAEPLTLVLLVVATAKVVVLRQVPEGLAIAAIVVLNTAIGARQEGRAQAAVEALERLTAPTARVRRSGLSLTVPTMEVVAGDLVELAAGAAYLPTSRWSNRRHWPSTRDSSPASASRGQGNGSNRCLRSSIGRPPR